MRAHVLRFLTLFLVTGVFALAVLVSDQQVPAPQQPIQLPPAVVTLGDSTLSGEGGGSYERGTNGEGNDWCHRSPAAPVHQLQLPSAVTRINLACSGAQAKLVGSQPSPEHSEGSQAQRLAGFAARYRITDVVVQIGANDDPGFSELVNRCVTAWASRAAAGCADTLRTDWPGRVERMQPKVTAALRDVRAVMERTGHAPGSYSLVVQSYAAPVSPDIPAELQNLSGCPFQSADLRWIRDTAVPQLSDGLRRAADQAGARFLDLSRAGRGHEACTGGNAHPGDEWFTRLSVDWPALQDEQRAPHAMQESFHANPAGHAQLARCLGDFLNSTEPRAVCRTDERGQLRAVPDKDAAKNSHP